MVQDIDKELAELFVILGVMSNEELERALRKSKRENRKLREVIFEEFEFNPQAYINLLRSHFGLRTVDLSSISYTPTIEALRIIPEELARTYSTLPLSVKGSSLIVAMENPMDYDTIKKVGSYAKKKIRVHVPYQANLDVAIQFAYDNRWDLYRLDLASGKSTKPLEIKQLDLISSPNDQTPLKGDIDERTSYFIDMEFSPYWISEEFVGKN